MFKVSCLKTSALVLKTQGVFYVNEWWNCLSMPQVHTITGDFDFIHGLLAKLASFVYVRMLCFSDTVSIGHWLILWPIDNIYHKEHCYAQTNTNFTGSLLTKIIELMKQNCV